MTGLIDGSLSTLAPHLHRRPRQPDNRMARRSRFYGNRLECGYRLIIPEGRIGVATAVRAAPAFVAVPKQTRAPPRRSLVVALALAGFIAAVGSYKLSLAGEYGPLPHVHAALVAWIVVAYVGCGLSPGRGGPRVDSARCWLPRALCPLFRGWPRPIRGASRVRRGSAASARRSLPSCVPRLSERTARTPLRSHRRHQGYSVFLGSRSAAAAVRGHGSRRRHRPRRLHALAIGARRPRGGRRPHLAQAGLGPARPPLARIARRLFRSCAGRSRRRHHHVVGRSARKTRSPLGGVRFGGHRARASPRRTSPGHARAFRGRRPLRRASPRPGSSRAGAGACPRSGRPVRHARLLAAGVRELRESDGKAVTLPEPSESPGAHTYRRATALAWLRFFTTQHSRRSPSSSTPVAAAAQHLAGERAAARRASRAARGAPRVTRADRRVRAGGTSTPRAQPPRRGPAEAGRPLAGPRPARRTARRGYDLRMERVHKARREVAASLDELREDRSMGSTPLWSRVTASP